MERGEGGREGEEGREGGRVGGDGGGRGGVTVIHNIMMAPYIYRPTMKNYIYITMTSRIT